jgi:hypothetical protein
MPKHVRVGSQLFAVALHICGVEQFAELIGQEVFRLWLLLPTYFHELQAQQSSRRERNSIAVHKPIDFEIA